MSFRSASLFFAALLISAAAIGSGFASTPFPTPLTANAPSGSLIYGGSTTGNIAFSGDGHNFTLPLDAGQTITVDVVPGATLQPSVELRDPAFNLIGSATAAGAGQEALLETVPVTTAGTYTMIVSGGGTTGAYTLKVTLNAFLEPEAHGGTTDDTIATAQDLSSSSVPLVLITNRMAVLGRASSVLDVDYYSFPLDIGASATIALTSATSATASLELRDGSDNVLATGVAGPANVTRVIRNFFANSGGTFYVRIASATGPTDYSLVITRRADFDVEGNDTFAGAQDLQVETVLGAIGNGGCPDNDYFFFAVNAGDNLVLTTATPAGGSGEFVNTLHPTIDLYDGSGNLVASATGNAGDGRNSVINWTALSSGLYRARVTGAGSTTGEYVLTIQGATGGLVTPFTPSTPIPCSALTDASPAHLWIGLKNSDDQGTNFDMKVELLKNGNVVTSGLKRCITGVTRNPSLAKEGIVDFDAFSAEPVASNDVIALRVSTRIGTNPDDTKCAGHTSATGLRLYYDSTNRESRFDATITPNSSEDLYLHSDGTLCGSAQSAASTFSLDKTAPVAANPRCRDSGSVSFSAGNPFSVIGTWSLAPLP